MSPLTASVAVMIWLLRIRSDIRSTTFKASDNAAIVRPMASRARNFHYNFTRNFSKLFATVRAVHPAPGSLHEPKITSLYIWALLPQTSPPMADVKDFLLSGRVLLVFGAILL